ncbi:hypothetical protein Ocin01_13723, partial [Orchesella cincta]
EGLLSPGLTSTAASSAAGIRVQRVRKASFRFSECDGDEDLPQFQGSREFTNMGALALGTVLSWSAVALPDLRRDGSIPMTLTEESWIGSII